MPTVITTIRPTTELEAVNVMLASIGEAPLATGTNLATSTQADVETALNILKNNTREVQSMFWKFNTEYGVQLAPTATYSWVDRDGATTLLNIFKRPAEVLGWYLTKTAANAGLDLVERPSKGYTESSAPAMVLYDRTKNRDGPQASQYPYVYIDTASAFDFEQCPESARRYIAVKAAREFSQYVLGSGELRSFSAQDELYALRTLKRDQGLTQDLNMLSTAESQDLLGRRPASAGGYSSSVYPGKAP